MIRRRVPSLAGGEPGGALDGDVVGLRGAGGEHDLPRLGADQRGDLGPGGLDRRLRVAGPCACSALCGLPNRSVNHGSMAATTRGSQGVVAWLSR